MSKAAARQHVIDDLRETNKKLLETQKKMYDLNPLRVFRKVIIGCVLLVLAFAVVSVALFPLALQDALKQQSPEHQNALAGLKLDAEKYQENMHREAIRNIVVLGRALPEDYGETYESLGVDKGYAEASAREQDEMKEWILSFGGS